MPFISTAELWSILAHLYKQIIKNQLSERTGQTRVPKSHLTVMPTPPLPILTNKA
jgi:hypothetical protein